MKQGMFLVLLASILSSCDSDDNKHMNIPSVVLNSFQREYPDALDVDWQQRDSLYAVDFELNNRDHSALINSTGKIIGGKQEILLKEIPQVVLSGLQKNFNRSDLNDPERVILNGRTLYQLELDKFLFEEEIVLDEEGNIITDVPYWE